MNRRDKALRLKQQMRQLELRRAALYRQDKKDYRAIITIGIELRIKGFMLNRLKRQAREEIRERPKPAKLKRYVRHLAR